MKGDPVITEVNFTEEGTIVMGWVDPDEQDRFGMDVHMTYIHTEAMEGDQQVGYWAAELRQDIQELLAAWRNFRRV